MFRKLLIANRGEIACRIIRTCNQMGIKTVAVYSDVDQDTLHVKMADEAHLLGGGPPQESYLNMDRLLEVAQISASEAVHPGYGFLSQNPVFASRCQESEVKFVGPTPHVMEKMGDKLKARKLARKAGLPVLPGTSKAVDDAHATSAAWELGLPLMVKAAAGGGGIGIHIIQSLSDLESVIQQERALASSAFGSPQLYFERYMQGASHIEVQVLGDEHGNLVHIFERDCSIQRRNQKILEETPATKLSPEQRRRLWDYSLKLAKYIGYTNAGTIEYLVSPEGQVYFLEMNTRLQVEHGITEMVSGLDMVELQIRVAAGETLPFVQDDIQCHGHAIEARIYPEDPETFLPQAGIVSGYHEPSGKHIRVDSALKPNYEVTTYYESLMAKLMCWGENREEARKRMQGALEMFRIEGVTCNIPALQGVVSHSSFLDATYHTDFLSIVGPSLVHGVGGREHHVNGNGNGNGNGRKDKELAAAIGVALLMSMANASGDWEDSHSRGSASWRLLGRKEQMLSRTLGSRGWQ